jgi:hypothetical protein
MPAAEQAEAYLPAHRADAFTNPSAMTVEFMVCVVTHSAVSSTDFTDALVCGSVKLELSRLAGGFTPARMYMASAAAAWASRQIGL